MDLHNFFDRCVVISLKRTPQRLVDFHKRIAECDWPFRSIDTFTAIDGNNCRPAKWWQEGRGSWGVKQSITRIIEDALNDGLNSVFIMEDDAVPCVGFREKIEKYLNAVPNTWQQLYVGGQHIFQEVRLPVRINEFVYRPYNCNRCQGIAFSRAGMEIAYKHLHKQTWPMPKTHIDHWFGKLAMERAIEVYAPWEWLLDQAEGQSTICGQRLEFRHWKDAAALDATLWPTVVAVLGPWRSGTSCVAGALHHLGVSMGQNFAHKANEFNPTGYWEEQKLLKLCQQCLEEPRMRDLNNRPARVSLLKGWLQTRKTDGAFVGAKHAGLCLMVPAVVQAFPKLKVVSVTRPIEESVRSLEKTNWWPGVKPDEKRKILQNFIFHRDKNLKALNIPTLELAYPDLLANPVATVSLIAEFVGIKPSPEEVNAAIDSLKPELNHAEPIHAPTS